MSYSSEQHLHDGINLIRLSKILNKSISATDWTAEADELWIKAQSTLQKVKYARRLLKNVEADAFDPPPKTIEKYHDIKMILDRVQQFVENMETRLAPKPTRPEPILPHIPIPVIPPTPSVPINTSPSEVSPSPGPGASAPSLPTDDLLLSPSDVSSLPSSSILMPSLLSPSSPASATKSTTTAIAPTPKFLQNSSALQQELSDQLAQMATQLKRNAIHFSESLSKDKSAVEEAQEKIEGNYDVMKKERARLRDHSGKSGSTTWITMLVLLVVAVLFALMFIVIRLT